MTTQQKFIRQIVLPGTFPIAIIIVTATLIIGVGETLLSLFNDNVKTIERPELWVATSAALLILGIAGILATRPPGSLGILDQELAIGKRPLLADPLPPVDILARRGPIGTDEDLANGYLLYARNGQIGVVRETLRNVPAEVGHLRKGFIYAQGVYGANDQMWIPIEAVSAVYTETRTAFLAIAGDEIEAYGWNNPPASFSFLRKTDENKLY